MGKICTSAQRAIERGILSTFLTETTPGSGRNNRVVVGLVPDGVQAVYLYTLGFAAKTVPTASNVFFLSDTVTEPPSAVKLLR